MNKIISIHAYACNNRKCPERHVCYLCKRPNEGNSILPSVYRDILNIIDTENETSEVHIATDVLTSDIKHLIKEKAVITIPFSLYRKHYDFFKDKKEYIQVTVYKLDDIFLNEFDLLDVQKLFLIKDNNSLQIASEVVFYSNIELGKIHFPIDIEYAKENMQYITGFLLEYIKNFGVDNDSIISIDNCAIGCLINKQCPYIDNYVDINYDGTYRKCPFAINGFSIGNKSINDMISTIYEPKCWWSYIFSNKRKI